MRRWRLFWRLMIRPLGREPVRTALTVLAVSLGVAVVLAIDLAGRAATGSFESSLEALAGKANLEVVATGGVPDGVVGDLARLPFPLHISPRVEDYATISETKQTVPLVGIDLVAEADRLQNWQVSEDGDATEREQAGGEASREQLREVWLGAKLQKRAKQEISFAVNDQVRTYRVAGTYDDSGPGESAIVMDIAEAQRVVGRLGRVDRVLLETPNTVTTETWQKRIAQALPEGILLREAGAGKTENRRMLGAFRWNLRLLSYIALIVGAFLIYNTISVSVVRRRAEIGIVRAIGGSRWSVVAAFLGDAGILGMAGALIGLALGRLMTTGAVKLMASTVNSLYVSSKPGEVGLTWGSLVLALLIGVGTAVLSAYVPAREAALVSPVEAMARGRREYLTRTHRTRDLLVALVLGISTTVFAGIPAIQGKPIFGYLATLLLIASAIFAIPAFVDFGLGYGARLLRRVSGVEQMLAARSLRGSLRRTSVLVGALSTAVAMMVAVGIMVGSFRETVAQWMEQELPADLYVRPEGRVGADRHPTFSREVAEKIEKVPGVAAVKRLRAYEFSFEGLPAELLGTELDASDDERISDFLSGRRTKDVLDEIRGRNAVILSEPFADKHRLHAGDSLSLPLANKRVTFRVADICYDYGSERGYVLMDRNVMLQYLPDEAPTNLAIRVAPGANPESVRGAIEKATAGSRVLVFSNRELREQAIRIFDRTFAITYALEAVAVMVAVMGVAGALLALVIDRRRELGLLRFLGAASAQIRSMILAEAGLLGLLSNAAGLGLGFLLSLILIYVINKQSFGWTIRFHWPVAVLFGALTLVYLATVLSAFYPARVAVEMNPLEAMHEE